MAHAPLIAKYLVNTDNARHSEQIPSVMVQWLIVLVNAVDLFF